VWHGAPAGISSVAFNASGDRVASGTSNGDLQLWDARTGSILAASTPGGENIEVAFSPDGKYLVTGSSDGIVKMWDMSSSTPFDTPMWTYELRRGLSSLTSINSVAFSPSGKNIIVGSGIFSIDAEGYVTVLNSNGTLLRDSIFQNSVVYQAVFSTNRSCTTTSCPVFLALRNGTLRQIDAITGNTIGTPLTGHTNIIWSTDVSHYMKCPVSVQYLGNCVVTGARDRTIRLWNVSNGQPIGGAWLGHLEEIFTIVFSPDGKRVISGSGDRTVRLWDVVSGQQLGSSWVGHEASVTSLDFSPDGHFLVSGSDDGTLRLWNVRDLNELAAWVCGNRYARYLTDAELQKYGVSRAID
ncbi:MAG: WD40 repeat domain-containing protein, partial [Taibaiella sp.]|nr:WD40 repeat domain-containing protein [Taibaiella sp.]